MDYGDRRTLVKPHLSRKVLMVRHLTIYTESPNYKNRTLRSVDIHFFKPISGHG